MNIKHLSVMLACIVSVCLATARAEEPAKATAAEVLEIRWSNPPENPPAGVTHHTFPSACMDVDVGYNIYLPPDYQQAADHRYPVIYFLHGAGGHESKHIFAAEYVQSFITSGQVPPLIVVFVNGGRWTMYLDSRDGTVKSETLIITELIPHIDRTYRTIADRSGRAIEGFSMGGMGAVRLAIKYPELFSSAVGYGGAGVQPYEKMPPVESPFHRFLPVIGDDLSLVQEQGSWYLLQKNHERVAGRVGIRLVAGSEDGALKGVQRSHDYLDELKVPHQFEVVPDIKHDIRRYFRLAGLKSLQFQLEWFRAAQKEKQ